MVGLPLLGKEGSGTPVFKILVRALVDAYLSRDVTRFLAQTDDSVLPRPRSRENIAEITAKSRPKHPSCESCRGRILLK